MLADATGLDLTVSTTVEASSLGAAVTAAVSVGWYEDFDAAAAAMSRADKVEAPDPARRAVWDALLAKQDRLNRFVCAEAAGPQD
jgi:xylulokinase